jgi:CpXC motif protein
MSMFNVVPLPCPSCGKTVDFNAVISVNADRRPDLRAAILDGSFQREACPQCNKEFRLDPELTYMDVGRGQWIAAYPVAKLPAWQAIEAQVKDTFDRAYGERASRVAREIGAGMTPRLTFGWSALREKLVIVEYELDDVIVELAKTALVRGMDKPPVALHTEMRFLGIQPGTEGATMAVAWLNSNDEGVREIFQVPRSLYDGIAADMGAWDLLRTELLEGPFVDMNRLLVEGAAASPSGV